MPSIEQNRRVAWALLAGLVASTSACGGSRQVTVMFATTSPAGEGYECYAADPKIPPENRPPHCDPTGTGDPTIGNRGDTVAVDVVQCATGSYHSIIIVEAEAGKPTAYVKCAQPILHKNLRGDAPPASAPAPTTAPSNEGNGDAS